MSDETCTFSYVATIDCAPKIATGIESTWLNLKIEFHRVGDGLPGAKYYKRISQQGPELFAVKPDQTVWYHHENEWRQYRTAKDIQYSKLHSTDFNPKSGTFSSTTDDDDEPAFGQQDDATS